MGGKNLIFSQGQATGAAVAAPFCFTLSMDFINSQLSVAELPAIENISLQPIHPSYRKVLQAEWWITTVFLLLIAAALIYFIPSTRTGIAWIVIGTSAVLLSLIHFVSIERSFPFIAFAIREKDVILQRGWLIRSVKICPFNRIQNCSVQSGPLERKRQLASLVIYTAGSSGADIKIPGLQQEEADRLRYFILEKIHTEPDEAI